MHIVRLNVMRITKEQQILIGPTMLIITVGAVPFPFRHSGLNMTDLTHEFVLVIYQWLSTPWKCALVS